VHIGLAGAGRIGAFHAGVLRDCALVDRLTVADADPERAGRVASAVGAGCVASPDELPAAGIDALVIAAATPAHAQLIALAAGAGLPCFCEKPIALDLATTDATLELVRRAGILLQIGFQRRFDAGYRAAREAVASGTIGELYLVRLAGHDPTPPPEEYVAASGGIFVDLAVHDFDIAAWVLGRPVVEVYADGVTSDPLFARHHDVDVAAAVLRFEGDVMGVLSAARNDPRGYDIRMELFGSRDSVVVGLSGRTPLRSLEPGVPPPAEQGWRDFMERFEPAYRAELQGFLESVRARTPSLCDGDAARRAVTVALAADRSRAERRPVAVAEIG
jgi:myo-inositol 2-dehydrogenase / D-chiro-inositol 1-dehydrogenase